MTRLDTNWLILLRQSMPPCFRTHGCTITFNNIGLLAETFKFHFAKKSDFKTGGFEYHQTILSTELLFYHASAQSMACLLRRIDRQLYFARSHASSPAVFWQKVNCTGESPSPAVCTFNSRASCGFFSLQSCHCFQCMPKKCNP